MKYHSLASWHMRQPSTIDIVIFKCHGESVL
uniref:Uncharacterized protein n=1 Tax=Anguilla anguilla TaxID=7936 RepID=A0A0E9UY98_ANGAN